MWSVYRKSVHFKNSKVFVSIFGNSGLSCSVLVIDVRCLCYYILYYTLLFFCSLLPFPSLPPIPTYLLFLPLPIFYSSLPIILLPIYIPFQSYSSLPLFSPPSQSSHPSIFSSSLLHLLPILIYLSIQSIRVGIWISLFIFPSQS